jgi:hypothetical protein
MYRYKKAAIMKMNILFSILTKVFVSFTVSANESVSQKLNKHSLHHARKHGVHHVNKKLHRTTDPSYQNE